MLTKYFFFSQALFDKMNQNTFEEPVEFNVGVPSRPYKVVEGARDESVLAGWGSGRRGRC